MTARMTLTIATLGLMLVTAPVASADAGHDHAAPAVGEVPAAEPAIAAQPAAPAPAPAAAPAPTPRPAPAPAPARAAAPAAAPAAGGHGGPGHSHAPSAARPAATGNAGGSGDAAPAATPIAQPAMANKRGELPFTGPGDNILLIILAGMFVPIGVLLYCAARRGDLRLHLARPRFQWAPTVQEQAPSTPHPLSHYAADWEQRAFQWRA